VLTTSARASVVGYDIVFAAPRPVSILIALDPRSAPGVIDAHRSSVGAALDYLEERAVTVRDRRGGEQREWPGRWGAATAFTHGVNRHGEPHLHDHVLVGARPLGASGVLDSRSLFAHARSADALYRASLRAGVAERTPWRPWRGFSGVEHVAGVDEGYRALWGGHHDDRGGKLTWTRVDATGAWAQDLQRLDERGAVTPPARDDRLSEHAFAASLEGRVSVARRDLVTAWADATTYGQRARDVAESIDSLYPGLRDARGFRGETLGVPAARMTALVRQRGPRPLARDDLDRWRGRTRDLELDLGRGR
ncbi:MAG: relaxase domain-containing protein, partial [Acidimicrobiales bacterium]